MVEHKLTVTPVNVQEDCLGKTVSYIYQKNNAALGLTHTEQQAANFKVPLDT